MSVNASKISKAYWDGLAEEYQATERIRCDDYHHGPLLPGDSFLRVLPDIEPGMRCLEVGSGAAQNSIYLATRGAICTATDISAEQLAHGSSFAIEHGVSLTTHACPMEQLAATVSGPFELVHSSGALCFSSDPASAIRQMAGCLMPGGSLVLSTIHPLAFAEWLEFDDEGFGAFLPDYFTPPTEEAGEDAPGIAARTWPISTIIQWVREAGLCDIAIWEAPAAKTPDQMPYWSDIWLEHQPHYSKIPLMLILRAK